MNLKMSAMKRRGSIAAVLTISTALTVTQAALAVGGGIVSGSPVGAGQVHHVAPATVMAAPVSVAAVSPRNAPVAAENLVTIVGFAYSPSTLTVGKGTTVTWTNNDSAPHTVTGSGGLNSPTLSRGASYSFTFNSAGTFTYTCTIHPSMQGTVVVS